MSKSSNSTTGVILLKLLLSVPFFFLLYTLKENHSDDRLAVLSALKNDRHSLRIFRGFAEVCLLIFCTAICIKVLDESLGKEMVSVLLFGEAQKEDDNEVFVKDTSGDYRLVSAAPIDGIEENEPTTLINDLHPSTSRIASSGMDMILLLSISLLLFTINSDYTSKYSHLSFPFLPSSVFPLTLFFSFSLFYYFSLEPPSYVLVGCMEDIRGAFSIRYLSRRLSWRYSHFHRSTDARHCVFFFLSFFGFKWWY